jgi:hypothetical protein
MEAPPPLDTWDFLRAGREGTWSKDPEPLEGKSKKQTSTKSKKNAWSQGNKKIAPFSFEADRGYFF